MQPNPRGYLSVREREKTRREVTLEEGRSKDKEVCLSRIRRGSEDKRKRLAGAGDNREG